MVSTQTRRKQQECGIMAVPKKDVVSMITSDPTSQREESAAGMEISDLQWNTSPKRNVFALLQDYAAV